MPHSVLCHALLLNCSGFRCRENGAMIQRKLSWILILIVAAACAACTPRGEQTTVEAGAFTIVREQHSYRHWNTGGTTEYYTFVVRYRQREFQFPVFSSYGSGDEQTTDVTSSRLAAAYIVSQSPAALLVLAGDPNNHASWNLLVDTPGGLRAEHVAFHTIGRNFAWLDGDTPAPIDPAYDLLNIEGGRLLWVDSQALINLDSLRIHRLLAIGSPTNGAGFVAFSPDRKKLARFDTYYDVNDLWHPVILENDIASGKFRSFTIDKRTMWFDDSRDIDREWLESYFEWRNVDGAGFALQPLANPKPRPYHGRLEVEPFSDTNAMQYHVPRLLFKHRRATMDYIAEAMGGTYVIDEPEPYTQEPPAATAANDDTAPRTNAALPPGIGPIASADLDIKGKHITIYFSESGLSIENHDPAMNEVVRTIAAILDAEFASPAGQKWITDGNLNP